MNRSLGTRLPGVLRCIARLIVQRRDLGLIRRANLVNVVRNVNVAWAGFAFGDEPGVVILVQRVLASIGEFQRFRQGAWIINAEEMAEFAAVDDFFAAAADGVALVIPIWHDSGFSAITEDYQEQRHEGRYTRANHAETNLKTAPENWSCDGP